MARTELDDYDDLSFNFDDDYDMGGADDTNNNSNDRKPRSKIIRTLRDSAEQKYKDSKYRRELLKASLPSDYSSVLDDYDTVSKEAGGIWRDQQREWDKHRKEVKKMFKPYADVLGGVGFKKFAEWANTDERSRDNGPSDEEQDELRIQGILSDTFGQMQEQNSQQQLQMESARQAKDDERNAVEKTDRDSQIKQTIEGNQLLLSINNSTSALSTYNNKINYPYQKRSLELAARQLITQQRMLQTMNSFRELAVKELQDIHKNTALPDYLKITPAEMAQQSIANKVMNTVTAPFDGQGAKLANRVAGKVRSKLKDTWTFLGETVTAANMQNEDMADGIGGDGTAWGGLKSLIGGMASDMAINKPANLIKTKLAPKIQEMVEKHTGAKLFGSNLKSMGGQFSMLFNRALKTGNSGNKLFDSVINGLDLGDAAITGNRQIHDTKQLKLEQAAYMDNRFKLSVTDVIPAWLKKIYSEMFSMNNNGSKAEDVIWDFKSGKFVNTKAAHDDMMDSFVDKDKVKAQVTAVNKWVDIIGQQALSSVTRKWVEKWVLKQINSSDPINPLYLLSDEVSMPANIREELSFVLPATLGLSDKQRELLAGGTMFDVLAASNKGSQSFNEKMSKASDAELTARSANALDYKKLDELGKTPEGRQFLLSRGIAVDNNGSIELNDGFAEQLYDQFEMYRKGNNGKKDRRYQRNQHIQYEDGNATLSDDMVDLDTDYDDAEVRQRKNNDLNFHNTRMDGMSSFYDDDEVKGRNAILKKVKAMKNPDSPYNQGWGTEYFIDKQGNIHTSAEKDFLKKRKKLRPDIERKLTKGYASGGRIESFAKGGETSGEPDQGRKVEMHGGEFVVSHDATKFNVQLLQAINKFGAPLVNADGTVNSVYHKLFGFKSAKDFDARAKAKGLTNKANDVKNEQLELMLKNIVSKLDMSSVSEADAKAMVDAKKSTETRLAKAMALWSKQQKEQLKANPKLYARNLGNRGVDILNGKFDKWLDSDGTGVNVEIKNKLFAGAKGGLKTGRDAALAKLNDAKRLAKSALIDRDSTLANVKAAVDADVGNKPFAKPQDIYMEGMKNPILRRFAFSQRIYYDQKTGQVIKSPLDITGTVVNGRGDVILSNDDLLFSKFFTMDKGHVIPFKFLGADDSNRKFSTSKEYAMDRINIIKGSQRYKDMMAQANAAKDKYVMDKPIDIYLRGEATPILYAAKFKEGFYTDQNTGNVLWTHHDITGPVIDKDGNIVLTAEQLVDGLFDVEQKHVKISKIKQIRNMVFRRGAEVYNKYAAKHVNKAKDKAMNWASKMGEKTTGMNFDNKPIDVYVKGEDAPRITAQHFKNGQAFDIKSEKVLKSHSGISGPVVNTNDRLSMLIYEKDFATGLVDAMGEPLHLPLTMSAGARFKSYLMEAALPKKTFGKLKNFITMSPEKRAELMNEKLAKAKIAYDVYVVGNPVTAIMTKVKFEAGEYISVKSGKVIHIPEQIDGAIVDALGNQILSPEDFEKGLVTVDGRKINMMGGGVINSIRSAFSIGNRLKATLKTFTNPAAAAAVETPTEAAKNHTYTIRFKMKKGMGLTPDLARINNTTFTDEDIKNGRLIDLDFDGKSTKVTNVKNITRETWLTFPNRKIGDGVSFSVVFSNNGAIFDEDGKFIKTAHHTGKKTVASAAKTAFADKMKGMFGSAFDGIKDKLGLSGLGERLGSWQQQRRDKANQGKDGKKAEEKKEKKDSWMGKLIKRLMFPLTGLFGLVASGIGTLKASLLTAFAWLGKAVVTKSLGGGLGSVLGGMMGGGGRGGRFGGLAKAALAGSAVYGGIQGYNYLDGKADAGNGYAEGDQNAAGAGQDVTSKVLNMADEGAPKDKDNGSFLDTALNNPLVSAGLTAAMFAPGTALRGARFLGRNAMRGGRAVGGAAMGGLGRLGARAAGGIAGRAPGMLGLAARGIGAVAGGVGKLGGLSRLATGGAARLAIGAGGLAFGALRLLSGPVGWGLTAAWYGGKALMKLWNNHKNPWNRFRMAQYGFNHNDKELMEKIGKIEGASIPLVKISNDGKCTLGTDEKAMNEILQICGFKDEQGADIAEQQARLPKFAQWYKNRFVRVYASYLRTLKRLKGKAEMIDLQTLNRKEQEILLKEVHFASMTDTPYVVTASPFEDPVETERDTTDVDVIARKLRSKIEQLPQPQNYKEPADYGKDGLDDKTAKPVGKDATREEKLKAAGDAQLDKQALPGAETPKTAIDKANQAVKYQADAAAQLTKTNNAAIMAATDEATKQTQKKFDEGGKGLMDKFSGFVSSLGTRFSNAWDKIKSGDVLGGVNDAAGTALAGMTGGLSDKVGQGISVAANAAAGWMSDGKGLGGKAKWHKGKRDDLFSNISAAAKKYGLSERTMLTMAYIESRGDPNASNPSGAKGIYQFMPGTAQHYGLGNPFDQSANIEAGMKLAMDNIKYFKKKVGRDPEPHEIYLMHQQGQGGLAIIANAAASGQAVPSNIQKNMDGNAPQKGMGAAAFLAHWKNKYAESDISVHGNAGGSPAPLATTTAGVDSSGKALPVGIGKPAAAVGGTTPSILNTKIAPVTSMTPSGAKTAASTQVTQVTKNAQATAPATGAAAATAQQAASNVAPNNSKDWDFSKIAKAAIANAKPKTTGLCGQYTRIALMAGDLKQKINKLGGSLGAHAYQFVDSLPKIGFNAVFQGKKFGNFVPQIGDVAIFGKGIYGAHNKSSGGWVSGHACVYTGAKWVSDFVQQSVYPSTKYAGDGLMMTIFRADGIAPQGGFNAEASSDQTEAGTVGGISKTMNNVSNGTASPTGVPAGGSITGNGGNAGDYGTVNNVLIKQLDVQREILSVLKSIAGQGGINNTNSNTNSTTNDPNGIQTTVNGQPVDANGNPINQQTPQGMTLPQMGNSMPQGKAPSSPFEGVKNPVSVTKPV